MQRGLDSRTRVEGEEEGGMRMESGWSSEQQPKQEQEDEGKENEEEEEEERRRREVRDKRMGSSSSCDDESKSKNHVTTSSHSVVPVQQESSPSSSSSATTTSKSQEPEHQQCNTNLLTVNASSSQSSSPAGPSSPLLSPLLLHPVSPTILRQITDQGFDASSEEGRSLIKRNYVLRELVETERDYVRDLGLVVDGYIRVMSLCSSSAVESYPSVPEDLKGGRDKILFGNIEAIHEWHRDVLLAEIEKCLEEPQRLGLLFKRYERRLGMYIVYCRNKPRSEHLVSQNDLYFEVSLLPFALLIHTNSRSIETHK